MTGVLGPGPRLDHITSPTGSPVPVTVLTGFLGAGKTTLLNRILQGDHGLKVGVLVNDFGAVNIDAALIEARTDNMVSLTNGCVCCEIRDDLITSFEELLEAYPDTDYVILEASGIADPEGIVMTITDQRYEDLLRIDSVTCVIDAEGVFTHGDNAALAMLKLRQMAFADLVIVNKVDLVSPEAIGVIRTWIDRHLQNVRIVEAEQCDVPYEVLLSVDRFAGESTAGDTAPEGLATSSSFATWTYSTQSHVSIEELREAVRRMPGSVLRCKGFVVSQEDPETRWAFQSVGRRTTVTAMGPWGAQVPRTDIVVIGTADMNRAELEPMFEACVVGPVEAAS